MRVCSFSVSTGRRRGTRGGIAYLVVSRELVLHSLQLCDAGDGDGPVHDVVLLEQFCEHLCGAQRVDIGSDEEDDGGGGGEGRAPMCGEDAAIGLAVGGARRGRVLGWWKIDHA